VKQVIRQAGHSYLSTLDGKQLLKLLDSQLSASMTAVRLQTAPVALTVAFAALALIAVQLVSDIGILYLAAQPKAIPHIVEVDKLGRPAYLWFAKTGVTVGNRDVLAVYARMARGRICSSASDRWQLPLLPHVGQLLAMAAAARRPSSAGTSRQGSGQAARRSYRWCRPPTSGDSIT